MLDFLEDRSEHPQALKLVLVLAAVFILVLLGVRLAELLAFVSRALSRKPLLLVSPGIPGDFWLAIGIGLALPVFLLPAKLRKPAWIAVVCLSLLMVAVSGTRSAPGGAGLSDTSVGAWLRGKGYARCPAKDQVHQGLHADTVAEGWAQPGACPTPITQGQ